MTFGINLRDLHYFETIAELEHLGAATELLHRSQPALTATIRRLEQACEAPLFERHGRGIRLTAQGQALQVWARRIRLNVEDAQREMRQLSTGSAGHIRLGVVPTAAQFLLPEALQKLMSASPQITVKTTVGLGNLLGEKVQSGHLDMAVVTNDISIEGLMVEPMLEDNIVVVASKSHPLAQLHRTIELPELAQFEWILQPQGSPTRDWIDYTFDCHDIQRPKVRMEADMLVMLSSLLAGTEILGFVSRLHFEQSDRLKLLREINIPQLVMRRSLVAIWREDAFIPAACKNLTDYLKQKKQ